MPDRRDRLRRLGWTMGGLVAALAPHLLHLQPWVTAFVLAICAWRLAAALRDWRLPLHTRSRAMSMHTRR